MLSTILYLILLIFLIILIYWYYIYRVYFVKTLYKMPGIQPWPIIGNFLEILPISDILNHFSKVLTRLNSYTCKGTLGFDVLIFTIEENFIEQICTSKNVISKAQEYDKLHNWLSQGLLTSTGVKWMKRRKLLTPSFHFNILEQFIDVFNSCSDILIKKLKNEVGNEETNLYPYITLCTLDVIYESTMGVKVNAQLNETSEYVKNVKLISQIIFTKVAHLFKRFDFFYYFSRDYRKEKKCIEILHATTNQVITARRELLLRENNNRNVTDTNFGIKRRKAFLDILLESTIDGELLKDHEIREEVDTFLFEGHDTTSSAVTFTLHLLAEHRDVQHKVVDELKSIFGNDKERPVTFDDLQNMKYLEIVIKETLRLYPSVPLLGRTTDTEMEYNGMKIPKGMTVAIIPYLLHRKAEVFPDPEKFDPERFTPENKVNIGPYAYIPFSAGYRNCIGQKFAMLELKSILSKILRNFELLPAKNYKPILVTELILRTDNGLLVQLKDRAL